MGLAVVALSFGVAAAPVQAHHVGTYTARDNEISQNFKQLKFALQARKLDVALRLYEEGAIRRETRARTARWPAGLETVTREAVRAGDVPRAEAALALVFATLARDLAVEAGVKVAARLTPPEARIATANRFLEAIWRYWSLIDFAVSQRDAKAAVALRLAFDDAESVTRGASASAPVAVNPCVGPKPPAASRQPADPARLSAPFARIAETLSGVVQTLATVTRRDL